MAQDCSLQMPEDFVLPLLPSEELKDKYRRYLFRDYVEVQVFACPSGGLSGCMLVLPTLSVCPLSVSLSQSGFLSLHLLFLGQQTVNNHTVRIHCFNHYFLQSNFSFLSFS